MLLNHQIDASLLSPPACDLETDLKKKANLKNHLIALQETRCEKTSNGAISEDAQASPLWKSFLSNLAHVYISLICQFESMLYLCK